MPVITVPSCSMDRSHFSHNLQHSSSEESSKESTSSEKSSQECSSDGESSDEQSHSDLSSGTQPQFVVTDIERVESSTELRMSLSPPVDPTPGGQLQEFSYFLEGYEHHQLARQYYAANNYEAALREWKMAHLCGFHDALYYIGNCYNQGKGVEKNIRKVFLY